VLNRHFTSSQQKRLCTVTDVVVVNYPSIMMIVTSHNHLHLSKPFRIIIIWIAAGERDIIVLLEEGRRKDKSDKGQAGYQLSLFMYVCDRDMYLLRNVPLTCKVATWFQSQKHKFQYSSLHQEIEGRLQVCYIDSLVRVSESRNFGCSFCYRKPVSLWA